MTKADRGRFAELPVVTLVRFTTGPLATAFTGEPAAFNCAANMVAASLMAVPDGTVTAFVNPPTPTERVDCVKVGETRSSLAGVRREGSFSESRLRDSATAAWLFTGVEAELSWIVPVAGVAAVVTWLLSSEPLTTI
jgi:hypothetical protein